MTTTSKEPYTFIGTKKMKTILSAVMVFAVATPAVAGDWQYADSTDPMGSTLSIGRLQASQPINLRFPYAGDQYPGLVVRKNAKTGLDVIVVINEGQILCDDYSHTTVTVRFDDRKPFEVECSRPSDGSTNGVFLGSERKLVDSIATSKTMTVGLELYQNGTVYPIFDVAGIETARLASQKKAGKTTVAKKTAELGYVCAGGVRCASPD